MPPTPPSSENKILHFKISLSLTSNAAGDASPQAPLPMLKSTITGTASTSLSTHKKTKGRGFREGDADRPPVSPPATSSPLALTAAPIPRDVQVDFDDKTSWEYLFKVYWVLLKEKLALSLDELTNATNPWKELRESANIEQKHQNDVADLINSYKSLYPKWVFDLKGSVSSKRRRLHLLRLQLML
ncbi:hypothetical protein E1A91_D04G122200v1 [Gossypium mustelinum]|uniref:Uncharacterized protein n=2 Tax=Gossypium TaxID=3633 RepID=A0A5D2VD51_GOSMU|nr:hypothetical protein ES288_D04G127600v1 [Gossypium darwinii]TYI87239.1 hypothetical protein E1A91_D04G122200v1 [Gossypium mustelinum]